MKNAVNLGKSLASSQQVQEAGKIIAGKGSSTVFRDAPTVVKDLGGKTVDWVKKTSSAYRANDGAIIQTHWVENLKTGLRTLQKTILKIDTSKKK